MFIQLVIARISTLLQQTTVPYKQKIIILHFLWRTDPHLGKFEFRRIILTANARNVINNSTTSTTIINNDFFIDGDPATITPIKNFLNCKSCPTDKDLIQLNYDAIDTVINYLKQNMTGIISCGGNKYHKYLV